MKIKLPILLFFALLSLQPTAADAGRVHDFYCENCHPFASPEPLTGLADTLCLLCHSVGNNVPIQRLSNPTETTNAPSGLFEGGDASDLMGSYPDGFIPGEQTSHMFSAGDTKPEAGALPPQSTAMNLSYFGVSVDKVVCSRCHDPHEIQETNPQLLRLGAGSADDMCLDCHRSWNVQNNRGKGTHPMVPDYAAVAAAKPDSFRSAPNNFGSNGDITLVDGGVSCMSCHGVHWTDSDASTLDGKANVDDLNSGDGRLLRHDGPEREDPDQSLCQTCHNYGRHGGNSPTIGCLVCHGSHEYDPNGNPNYFMIKKQVTLDRPLYDENQPAQEITANLDYTDPLVDGEFNYDGYDGICLQCHYDNLSSGHDADREQCSNCHLHENGFAHGAGSKGIGCVECHGHDAGTLYDPDSSYPYTAGDTASQGTGTTHSHSTHTELDSDDLKGPGIYCDSCHDITNFPFFKSGTDSNGDGKYNLAETDVCDTCHSPGGTYDGIDDPDIGAKQIWKTGAYDAAGNLLDGKDKWCAGCHDEEPSVIQGVPAPNITGDEDGEYTYGTGWGYYKTGHGLPGDETYPSKGGIETLPGRAVDCDSCHNYATAHIDGLARTYDDSDNVGTDPSLYRIGYRLKTLDGHEPMQIPFPSNIGVSADYFRVCLQVGCHNSGPFVDSTNMDTNLISPDVDPETLEETPVNRHWFHLALNNQGLYATDWSGSHNSRPTCVTCHNVHGSTQLAMVRDGKLLGREPGLQFWYKNDDITYVETINAEPPYPADLPLSASDGTIWIGNSSGNLCTHCHGNANTTGITGAPYQLTAQAPTLEWTGEIGLISDGASPDTATSGAVFTFRVKYADQNNDAPNPIEVWIDLDDNGIYEADEKFAMDRVDIGDVIYTNGMVYSKSLSIAAAGDNTLNYRFYASDGALEASGVPTIGGTISLYNNAPTLAWTGEGYFVSDGINPNTGGNGASYVFRVDYADADDEAPTAIELWIDENDNGTYEESEKYVLNEVDGDTVYSDGKRYAKSLNLAYVGDGVLKYRFYASDGSSDASGDPVTDNTVTVLSSTNSPPTLEFTDAFCSTDGVKPQTGAVGANFEFTVNYTDPEGSCPTTGNIQVWIDVNNNDSYDSNEKYNMSEVDSGDSNCADGKLYSYTKLFISEDTSLNYRFYASDGTDTAIGEATADGAATVLDVTKVQPGGGVGWYSSLQSAVDAINGAHTIFVYEGTYNENVLFNSTNDNDTVIQSVCGPETTIVNSTGNVFLIQNVTGAVLDGLSITGGSVGVYLNGGKATVSNSLIHDNTQGIYSGNSSSQLTLEESEVYNNTATGNGGGIFLNSGTGHTVSNSIIHDNSTTAAGGGFFVQNATLTMTDSVVKSNSASGSGGAVYSNGSNISFIRSSLTGNTASSGGALIMGNAASPASFENCVIADNQAGQAGGIYTNAAVLTIVNSTIADNRATSNNSGAIFHQNGTTTIRNSILWGNYASGSGHNAWMNGGSMTISDSIVASGNDELVDNEPYFTGNREPVLSGYISENDPNFVGNGDYHLQAVSDAVDNASATYAPTEDIDGDSRPQGAGNDIGADEYMPANNAPTLSWTQDLGFQFDGADPDSAMSGSSIEFRVDYNDAEGDLPTVIELWIDLDDNGTYAEDEKFAMSEFDSGDTDVTDGKTYVIVKTLSYPDGGSLNYRFHAMDQTSAATGEPTEEQPVFLINNPPILTWTGETNYLADGVDPNTGDGGGTFTFRVAYTDVDNTLPTFIEVWIDLDDSGVYDNGEKFALSAVDGGDTDVTDGKLYTLGMPLSRTGDGNLKYTFVAADGEDNATGTPTGNAYVTVNQAANTAPTLTWQEDVCRTEGVRPEIGTWLTDFEFTVNYSDAENQCPSVAGSIQVWVDENDNGSYDTGEKHDLTEVDGADTDCSDGKLYSTALNFDVDLANSGDGQISYRFYASDGIESATGTAVDTGGSIALIYAQKARPGGGTDWNDSIQAAVDNSSAGDMVLIYPNADFTPGIYYEDVSIGSGKDNLTLYAVCGADLTVVDGSSTAISTHDNSGVVIDGFSATGASTGLYFNKATSATVKNSKVYGNTLGGSAYTGSSVTIEDSEIYNNTNGGGPGGLLFNTGTHLITRTSITGNSGSTGGAIYNVSGSNLTITESVINNNSASSDGGAIRLETTGTPITISDSYVQGNSSGGSGGAIYLPTGTSATLTNVIFSGNKASNKGGVIFEYGWSNIDFCTLSGNYAPSGGSAIFHMNSVNTTITNSIIYNNYQGGGGSSGTDYQITTENHRWSTVLVSNTLISQAPSTGSWPNVTGYSDQGGNNIYEAPNFVNSLDPAIAPTTGGDYHIQSGSPAINMADAGATLDHDIDGDIRPQDGGRDAGADEVVP